ncbi:BoLa class II histocompatibility antigen; DQB*0101 beta chain [Camelus dromedarius]|uniref:BoLa class II histocompatibility antigen n=1 Tax=Camelus dromedarius TaxID=9838 RepID=A0A5N4CS08_CAMDR|nr:BoLa class II histocompatibility antigen; DQB*0101 beta chain [Camelus dromedarius]
MLLLNRSCFQGGRMRVTISRNPWTAAGIVMVIFMVLRTSMAHGRGAPKNFVYQFKSMCYFTNGTEHVKLVVRQIYNKEEILHFDSDLDEFVAVSELGR